MKMEKLKDTGNIVKFAEFRDIVSDKVNEIIEYINTSTGAPASSPAKKGGK
jgi:hypothetical protein